MNTEKFNEIICNADFQKEAEGMKTIEDAQKLLAKYGLELSAAEVEKEFAELGRRSSEQGELSENELEDVAGGGINWWKVAHHVIDFAHGVYQGWKG